MAILLALVASLTWGISPILVQLGTRSVRPLAGVTISLIVSSIGIAIMTVLFQFQALLHISLEAIALFVFIGIINYALARYFSYKGIEMLGTSRATPMGASSPIFATVIAVLFLKETLTPLLLSGIMAIAAGDFLIARGGRKAEKEARPIGYAFSLGAALCWGGTSALVRWGASSLTTPLAGAFIASFTGTTAICLVGFRPFQFSWQEQRRGIYLFLLAGLVSSLSVAANYSALSLAPVSVISPLTNTYPLFSLFLANTFLRSREGITWKVVAGAVLIVLGGGLVTLVRRG